MARKKKEPKVEEEVDPGTLHFSTHCPDSTPHVLHGNFYAEHSIVGENLETEKFYDRDMRCTRCGYVSWNRLTRGEYKELQKGITPGVLTIVPKTPFKINSEFKPINGDA